MKNNNVQVPTGQKQQQQNDRPEPGQQSEQGQQPEQQQEQQGQSQQSDLAQKITERMIASLKDYDAHPDIHWDLEEQRAANIKPAIQITGEFNPPELVQHGCIKGSCSIDDEGPVVKKEQDQQQPPQQEQQQPPKKKPDDEEQ